MIITRRSLLSGIERTFDLPVTQDQIDSYNSGAWAMDAFPHLDADQREFVMTGITPEEWDAHFSE